ncbi:TIGR04076 family protein [Sporomusa termitida]|uniref:TIGR04076: family protein n=1 Tax=Sporomusa termitida TaxID=2377 RepID=A0A517DQA3_9FIRM|nr:TIGR04076 family protein [Sporomusa termitida]QDR79543.1 TIGR04076: family protein [Sporomusa termitida]
MKKWYSGEWSFKIIVLSIKPNNEPQNHCRNGHQPGDQYICGYACPGGFCSKSMLKSFPLMEAVRSGGNLRNLGGCQENIIEFDCPDGIVKFRLEAIKQSQ